MTPTEKWRKFIESPESYNYWVEGPDETWSRGIPNKVPYEMIKNDGCKIPYESSNTRYWRHYGYNLEAKIKPFKEFQDE